MRWTVDLSSAALLISVMGLNGIVRVPRDAYVFRRFGLGPWRFVSGPALKDHWNIVSWVPPFSQGIVVRGRNVRDRFGEFVLADGTSWPSILRALGMFGLCFTVLGVPFLSANFGAWGFLGGAAAAIALSFTTCIVTAHALTNRGASRQRARKVALGLWSPFTAPQASEQFLNYMFRRSSPAAVARELLSIADFRRWMRPTVFDALASSAADRQLQYSGLSVEDCEAILAAPSDFDGLYCPRCGQEYRQQTNTILCYECDVNLLRVSSACTPSPSD